MLYVGSHFDPAAVWLTRGFTRFNLTVAVGKVYEVGANCSTVDGQVCSRIGVAITAVGCKL